jgi:hypothetical protein
MKDAVHGRQRHLVTASAPHPDTPPMACVRCLDIADRWLTSCGGGQCNAAFLTFASFSDESLADQCISRWGLDQPQGEDNDLTWFEAHEADRDLLIWAFSALRAFATQTNRPPG